jgi:transketolase
MDKTNTIANRLRKDILKVAMANNKGHIAPSLSCLDILTVLYYDIINRQYDTVILSKGHGAYGLYAIWADLGIIPKSQWENFEFDGCLTGYGSLGHGLPIAVGMAFGKKLQNKKGHIYCITGNGEFQEGSMWEALSFMFHHKLNNITVIVDDNKLQAMDKSDNILKANLEKRFKGWGFKVLQCNGHNHKILNTSLRTKPQVLIANTIKGNGIRCMENIPSWHYKVPTKEDLL